MTQARQDLWHVHTYYTTPRPAGQTTRSIYDIWEEGGAFNDSITPSTYVPEYRSHMVLKILTLTADTGHVLSLGCGNGFVEADLVKHGRRVTAMDCNAEAVELARKKGVDAFVADFFLLQPEDVGAPDVVYADGLLGHLFDPDGGGFTPTLSKIESFGLKSGAYVVISNDATRDPAVPFAPHEKVKDFWFVGKEHLTKGLAAHGFDPVESYYFPYLRPISGLRNRTICVARVA